MPAATLAFAGAQEGRVAAVHPLALFSVCDSFIRRNEGQERVIGTLLGSVSSDGTVEIKNSYAVPHNESGGQVALDIEYHRQMLDLHCRVSPKDVCVGWYSTGGALTETDALIHDFYARECASPGPVLLEFDTSFMDQERAIRAWVGSALSVKDNVVGTSFVEVGLVHRYEDAHRVGMPLLTSVEPSAPPSDAAGLASSVSRLAALLELAHTYADAACTGKVKPDPALGRMLADAVAAVPRLPRAAFDSLFNDAVQDVLLVMYLSQLTRTQLALAEKLNTPVLM